LIRQVARVALSIETPRIGTAEQRRIADCDGTTRLETATEGLGGKAMVVLC
jgi:hypothetical protein